MAEAVRMGTCACAALTAYGKTAIVSGGVPFVSIFIIGQPQNFRQIVVVLKGRGIIVLCWRCQSSL